MLAMTLFAMTLMVPEPSPVPEIDSIISMSLQLASPSRALIQPIGISDQSERIDNDFEAQVQVNPKIKESEIHISDFLTPFAFATVDRMLPFDVANLNEKSLKESEYEQSEFEDMQQNVKKLNKAVYIMNENLQTIYMHSCVCMSVVMLLSIGMLCISVGSACKKTSHRNKSVVVAPMVTADIIKT